MAHAHSTVQVWPRSILPSRHGVSGVRQRAFTLIELMVVLAIIAVLAAIAVPIYSDDTLRARLTDGTDALAVMQAQMERYYQDNRTYAAYTNAATNQTVNPPCLMPTTTGTFTVSCTDPTDTAYQAQAVGSGQTAGFTYTIDQDGVRSTASVPANWPALVATPCNVWVVKKGQPCA
jgi:type IV pilus assembly protein PilE